MLITTKKLTATLITFAPISGLLAAGLDRTGQPIAALLKPGNYAEVNISAVDPYVHGIDKNGNPTGNVAETYPVFSGAIKIQPLNQLSMGIIFDQPFGAAVEYKGVDNFVSQPNNLAVPGLPIITGPSMMQNGKVSTYGLNTNITGGSKTSIRANSITTLLGYSPIKNLTFFAGPAYQEMEIDIHSRGNAAAMFNGYDGKVSPSSAWGWVAGASFDIPEIAFKATATYRSKIKYDANMSESFPIEAAMANNPSTMFQILDGLAQSGRISSTTHARLNQLFNSMIALPAESSNKTKFSTPQSVNLDLQTRVLPKTIAFINLRWVDWPNFVFRPAAFSQLTKAVGPSVGLPDGFNMIDYKRSSTTINLGLGQQLTQTLNGSASIGWDSGAGIHGKLLGPTHGNKNIGLSLKYAPSTVVDLTAMAKYFWLGNADAETSSNAYAGTFKGNSAVLVGMKLGYHF